MSINFKFVNGFCFGVEYFTAYHTVLGKPDEELNRVTLISIKLGIFELMLAIE